MRSVGKRAFDRTSINLEQLKKELPKVVENSYMEAVRYAAQSLIGRASPRGVDNRNTGYDAQIEFLSVAKWKALSPRTIREQNAIQGTKHSGKFFQRTGALKREILSMARKYVKRTGIVRVNVRNRFGQFQSINSSTRSFRVGQVEMRLLPNISRASLPGLQSGNVKDHNPDMSFEQKLGMSPEAVRKLRGAGNGNFVIPGTHRPLMQPVFTYWTLNKIPAVIAEKLLDTINLSEAVGKLE